MTIPTEAIAFPATRDAGLHRLRAFLPRAGSAYAAGRNTDPGPDGAQAVSRLSPYLRHRLLLEEEVLRAVVARHGPRHGERFIGEVLWRTYWKGWLELRPEAWRRYERDLSAAVVRLDRDADLAARYREAVAGLTGIDAFDAFARDLVADGWLHNHARMWFASIWIFTLRLPWTLGADLFLRHLVDADPASNTLSWRWVAGLQTKGKTYLATAENIARFTEGRFHPSGLATTAIPLEEDPMPPPRGLPAADLAAAGPAGPRLRPGSRVGLLVTEEDLAPETLGLDAAGIAAVALPAAPAVRARAGAAPSGEPAIGAPALGFVEGAFADAASRVEDWLDGRLAVDRLDASALGEAAARFAGERDLDVVVTAYPPVGPTADPVADLRARLAADGRALMTIRRATDTRAWPLATKGYFAFRESIPRLLAEMGARAS